MSAMFHSCDSLTVLDLTDFDTHKVTNMESMFNNCSSLKTIYVGTEWNTDSVASSEDMFYGCTSLVGGMGTTYDSTHVDKTYAHIDGAPTDPGYFSVTFTCGDVNDDGSVNISDVTTLIDYLLSGDGTDINILAADCNQDGSVNISDVTTLIDYLLSGNWP